MKDPKQAAVLLQAAERDFEAIRGMLGPEFHDVIFGQHVQQTAEKLLQAWLCLLSQQYPHRHDLKELIRLLETRSMPMEDFAALVEYTQYAGDVRYRVKDIPPLERPEAIRLVERLRTRVHDFWQESMDAPVPLDAGDRPV